MLELLDAQLLAVLRGQSHSGIEADWLVAQFCEYNHYTEPPVRISLPNLLALQERVLIFEALSVSLWDVSQAARQLGIKRRTLHHRMHILGIEGRFEHNAKLLDTALAVMTAYSC